MPFPLSSTVWRWNQTEGKMFLLSLQDLSCNELTSLPSTVGELVSLRTLKVRRNRLISLPDGECNTTFCSILDESRKVTRFAGCGINSIWLKFKTKMLLYQSKANLGDMKILFGKSFFYKTKKLENCL